MNQDPHQLDIWQWVCGLPIRVRAFCGFGKYHDIEVEDDVTAYVEYENGATGAFITSTGEAPGTNRFELVGDRGNVVIEDGSLTFWRLRQSEREFNRRFTGGMGSPECWRIPVPTPGDYPQHAGILQNWFDAIHGKASLIARGEEGVRSLELSNAMLLSSWTNDWVDIPVPGDQYERLLSERASSSRHKKTGGGDRVIDLDHTY